MKSIIENVKRFALLLTLVVGIAALANAQSKTVIKPANLQKGITDQISKDYAGYAIKNAYKIDRNKVITYEVNVVKNNHKLCLSYDNSGKFLKVMEPKSKMVKKTNTADKTTAMNHKKTTKNP
jgi:hypothetical protein